MDFLSTLKAVATRGGLDYSLKGLEREALRFTPGGVLAQTSHPAQCGSPLTHKYITTDFSESLMELVTPTFKGNKELMAFLADIHAYVHQVLPKNENLWNSSMPCVLESEEAIPIAYYGTSGAADFRSVYRRGLALRYGKKMQAIAGLHYNFSVSPAFWDGLALERQVENDSSFRSEAYLGLIRNFHRLNWFTNYLFGASPVFDKSFASAVESNELTEIQDNTYSIAKAVSVRMSDAGYTTSRQGDLNVSENSLTGYVSGLKDAVQKPDAQWSALGLEKDGVPHQLADTVLQAEFEYYSTIRPKASPRHNCRPLEALEKGGVEYVEVRTLDLDPFEPMGVSQVQLDFMEVFMYYLLGKESPLIEAKEAQCIRENLITVTVNGRAKDLTLKCAQMGDFDLKGACERVFDDLALVADLLDKARACTDYSNALLVVRERLSDPSRLPSEKMAQAVATKEFVEVIEDLSNQHREFFLNKELDPARMESFVLEYKNSDEKRLELEKTGLSYKQYLKKFMGKS